MLRHAFLAFTFSVVVAHAEVTPGEILLSEMNCVACHEVAAPLHSRLAPRQSPRLGADGVRATPQWLREFLTAPQTTSPGTLMPDLLHALPPEQKAEAAEALTHFLVSLQPAAPATGRGASASAIAEGERLYHTLGCAMCHAPLTAPKGREGDPRFAQLRATSVPLGEGIAKKFSVTELTRFLRDPLKARPSGRMPGMNLSEPEAEAIAMYLLREQVPAGASVSAAGLHYDYYEKDLPELPEFDRLTPTLTDVAASPSLAVAKRTNGFALRFRGNIVVPKDGTYTFMTESDDGSRLYIDGRLVVDNGGIHPKQERTGEVDLKAGAHTFLLTYFDGGGDTALTVRWKAPGQKMANIPETLFTHDTQPMRPLGDAPFAVDAAKVARGKQFFTELNCAACHQLDAPGRKSIPLPQIAARQPRGCLSTKLAANVPKFDITDRQRQVILALLQQQATLDIPLEDEQRIRRTMTTLNCYACHAREKRGGPEGLRRDYLASVGEVDLGEEGSVPPSLTNVGAKLRPEWIKTVLDQGEKVRPYMATRMPSYGTANTAHLPELFEKADARPDALPQPDVFAPGVAGDANKFGRKLVGTGGLSCIACHVFAGNASLGVPALDLANAGERLKWDWFRRYMLDPQSLRPGTRMPPFWPGGVGANKDILGGDAEKQLAAIWAYLARKNFTDLPAGLVRGKMELVATTEPVIYRNFIEGGGAHAIGVGYPEKANLCFDANEMRLAMIWQGSFIDAAKHRSGRGQGFEKPLGSNVVSGPPGAPFAVLASENDPWPAARGRDAGYQFRGYRLDDKRRPTFRYTYDGIDVEDFSAAVQNDADADLHRTITLKAKQAPAGKLYFRAAVGAKIEAQKDGAFLVEEKVRLHFPGAQPVIRESNGARELLVPVVFQAGTAQLIEHISW
ncbi:MAG: c-type cytochrome [Chthoniobacteraceae bacterium]